MATTIVLVLLLFISPLGGHLTRWAANVCRQPTVDTAWSCLSRDRSRGRLYARRSRWSTRCQPTALPPVSVDLGEIRLTFDPTDAHTPHATAAGAGPHPFPPIDDSAGVWQDDRTFVLPVGQLEPGTEYAVVLNPTGNLAFRDRRFGLPLETTTLQFRTEGQLAAATRSRPDQPSVQAPQGAITTSRQRPKTTQPPRTGSSVQRVHLRLYREQHQGAFTLLIPKGWSTEGGMVPSGVPWNVVDLVESNIVFRVTSPDGRSFFGWYPRFYFQDPQAIMQAGMGVMQVQTGGVLNGCWLYPYMSLSQYVETIVLGQFAASELSSARLVGDVVDAPELRPFLPRGASQAQCGSQMFTAVRNGQPVTGRIYAIMYSLGSGLWSTVGTFGLVAPSEEWSEHEPLMELCLRTFRLDPQWVARVSAATRRRGQQYNDVLRQMHSIDAEIHAHQSQTRSDINTEVYKVLTEQMETYDPETGTMHWMPMYDSAWTDGKGNYILTDHDGAREMENEPAWRRLEIVNRNDPDRRWPE